MFKIKAKDHRGERTFACGTADQAFDKAEELAGQGLTVLAVVDPAGKEWTAAAFKRAFDHL